VTGPLLMIAAGVVLVGWGFTSRRRTHPDPVITAARLRLVWDLVVIAGKLAFLFALMFAPKHVQPFARKHPSRSRGIF
jgi:hypothetical protein